jgi:hypothetical protein
MNDPEERLLDHMLGAVKPVEPSAALRRAVAEIPLRYPQRVAPAPVFGLWPARVLGALAASLVLSTASGVLVGLYEDDVLPGLALTERAEQSEAELQQDAVWEELALLAFADALDEELSP